MCTERYSLILQKQNLGVELFHRFSLLMKYTPYKIKKLEHILSDFRVTEPHIIPQILPLSPLHLSYFPNSIQHLKLRWEKRYSLQIVHTAEYNILRRDVTS